MRDSFDVYMCVCVCVYVVYLYVCVGECNMFWVWAGRGVMVATALEKKLFLSLLVQGLIVPNGLLNGSDSNMEWQRCVVPLIMMLAIFLSQPA